MRYPILLVHGILRKDFRFARAFGRIEKRLRAEGYQVFTSRIDGLGTTETNAVALAEEVRALLAQTGAEKVNLIAHSKGGLDCKRMLENPEMVPFVASLATLCTPHKGSPIATLLLGLPRPILAGLAWCLNVWYRCFGDRHPDALAVCRELALVEDIAEETMALPDGVYCQSYSATLVRGRDDFLMGIPLYFSRRYEQVPSDGLVSVTSARFGTYRGNIDEASISHTEVTDFMAGAKKRKKIHAFYLSLCGELAEMGF